MTRIFVKYGLFAMLFLGGAAAHAETPLTLFQSFIGHHNFQVTGNTLRTEPNSGNACLVGVSSSNPIVGVPATATVSAAYLYWAGSGSAVDATVALNGTAITADRTFTTTFPFARTDYDFFSGFADVTALIAGNGNGIYTFSGLTVNTGAPHCAVSAVLAGWSLVIVYEDPAEDLRAVNLFDGFQFFRGNAITLTPNNFRVPVAPINGQFTVITWEGDPQNSGRLGGFSERLTFNGALLDDGLIPPGSNPSVQQYDGTINSLGQITSYGVDIDTYDVSAFISAADTSATVVYSSGGDLVLLSVEIMSTTTQPFVDLEIQKSHVGNFLAGTNGDYTIRVTNNGPEPEGDVITVTDTLPAGMTYVSGTGGAWVCGAVGQDVSCTHPPPIPVGSSLADLTLTVALDAAAIPSLTNTASVSSGSTDNVPANDSSSDLTVVIGPDLSTSTKTVVDLNGGDADPGDILRYTILLNETGGDDALNVSVTDDMPTLAGGFNVVSFPAGATDNSTGAGTGANGSGFLNITNITVPTGSTETIVFEVGIASGAQPGDIIANIAAVVSPNGPGAGPAAADVIVSQSQARAGGIKSLYLFDLLTADPNGFNDGPPPYLSRTPPGGGQAHVNIDKTGAPVAWTMTPQLRRDFTITGGVAPQVFVPVTLYLSKNGAGGGRVRRDLRVQLDSIGPTSTRIGSTVTLQFGAPPRSAPIPITFNIPVDTDTTLLQGSQMILTLRNVTPGGGNRRIRVWPAVGGNNSRVEMDSSTVINVDNVSFFDAASPGGAPLTTITPGLDVFVRAGVGDPFGNFDIAGASLDIDDALGAPQVVAQAMTAVANPDLATTTFEFRYTVPAAGAPGTWTASVTANEGTEGIVRHQAAGVFDVVLPELLVEKLSRVISDPANGTVDPKRIPGATVEYAVIVTNLGFGVVDNASLVITDPVPANTDLFVDTSAGDPIVFTDGTTASGLGYTFASDVTFSSQPGGGPPYTYVPVPDAAGFDPLVTAMRINPAGIMNGASGGNNPSFVIRFRVRID